MWGLFKKYYQREDKHNSSYFMDLINDFETTAQKHEQGNQFVHDVFSAAMQELDRIELESRV